MSSASALDDAYRSFLCSSSLDSWTASLAAYGGLIDGTEDIRDARPVDICRALTIAIYVAWLSVRCGENERRKVVMQRFHDLSARLVPLQQSAASRGSLLQAVIAAATGYPATGLRLAQQLGRPLSVDLAVLMVPNLAMRRAAMLRPFVLEGDGSGFVPALYFYGSALLDLGYQSSVEALLDRHPNLERSALGIDLGGQLLELAGSWSEARDRYARSEWASHAYRKAVCDLILGGTIDGLVHGPADMVRKFTAGMLDFSAETDRAGVLRSASFVRACRSQSFDNWLVHFELGRLGFQRRRHTEAEKYLAIAERTAPAPFRFPIQSLRFSNFTWLGETIDIDMNPEAIEVGKAALKAPGPEEHQLHIRTWLGRLGGYAGLLDPVLRSSMDYERGLAHKIRGSIPDAVTYWCRCNASGYTPRAWHELLRIFASYGFEKTAGRLASIAALESDESFFDLWELAKAIAGTLEDLPAGRLGGGLLGKVLVALEARMQELIGSEFSNAIRAFHYFLARRRPAPIRRMLVRAERLAEGSEELLLVAIARRRAAPGGGDPRALGALQKAIRQSGDRFERLLIAREFVLLGEIAAARTILNEEGVFLGKADLTSVEYVLALQCAKACCKTEERVLLETTAIEAIKRDIGAERLLEATPTFVNRLERNVADRTLGIPLPLSDHASELGLSSWQEMIAAIRRFQFDRQAEQELGLLNAQIRTLSEAGSPAVRLALWGVHLDRFEAHLGLIDRIRPNIADDETPMARDLSLMRPRAQRVAKLWREHLLASEHAQADRQLDAIRAFWEEEREFAARWDRARDADADEPSKHALAFAKQGSVLLEGIGSDKEIATLWPPFLDIASAVVDDAKTLAARLQEQAALVRRRAVA